MSAPGMALWRDLREMVTEQVEYRELLQQMALRDLLLRYKQTAMGFAWALFMPLLNTAIFSVIFMRVAPIESSLPYPVFAYCGLLAWNFFAASLRFSVTSLTTNTVLVTKVYFPREIFPFSLILVSLVDFAVGSVGLWILMLYYGVPLSWTALALPLVVAVHVAFTAGVALLLAMGNLFYRDVKYIFEIVIAVWMFGTTVLYPAEAVGGRFGTLLQLNPMTPIIDAYRAVLLEGRLPDLASFTAVALVSACTFVGAWLIFHRAEFQFAERV
jgi:ABC-type polysaccharide/polyol phosphate export permease